MTGISVNIILDALKSASYSYFNGIKGKRNFVWVSILDGTEEIFDKHTLYICSQEDAVKYACEECCCL